MKFKTNKILKYKGDKPVLVMTITNEIFQPVRLYYQLHDIKTVTTIFNKLSCMQSDASNKRWVWFYEDEAKTIKLKKPYSSIAKEYRPLVIGSFYSKNNNEMYLDVGSIERAVAALKFFPNYLNKTIATPVYFAIYNKFLNEKEYPGANFDRLFADVKTEEIEANQQLKISKTILKLTSNSADNLEQQDFELIEALPINIEDGIKLFEFSLIMRQKVALRRWQGENVTLKDIIHEIAN
jgi:hypothetical protein